MIKYLFVIMAISIASLTINVNCEITEDDKTNPVPIADYSFLDQNLQGKIGGTDWEYVSGVVELNYWDNTLLSFDIYDIEGSDTNPCAFGAYSFPTSFILFSAPNETGLYELGNNQNVTLFEIEDSVNNIALEGAVEILTIDITGNVIGRMDVRAGSNNYVNGNFTVTFCGD